MAAAGTVVRRAMDSPGWHACHPPDCHEFAGSWVLNHGAWGSHRWITGDVWRCNCGRAWEVTWRQSGGVWESWVRSERNDGPSVMSTGQTPDPCPFPKVVWFDPAALELMIRLVGLSALVLVFWILASLGVL